MMLLLVYSIGALLISALCSILEASLLSCEVLRLSTRAKGGDKGAARLLNIKENRIEDAITAILLFNTVAHTVGAALGGAEAAKEFGNETWVAVYSGVLTICILIFTEILPKTVGTIYCQELAGFTSGVITIMIVPPFKYLVFVLRSISWCITRSRKHKGQMLEQADVVAVIKRANIHKDQKRLLGRIAAELDSIRIVDVMTPSTVVSAFDIDTANVGELVHSPVGRPFSRIPIYQGTPHHMQGYVLMKELLHAYAEGIVKLDTPVKDTDLVRDILVISETLPVTHAFREFQRHHDHIAICVDEFLAVSGLVTLEDILETMIDAEIVDETDTHVDMRANAIQLRDLRLQRIADRLKTTVNSPGRPSFDERPPGPLAGVPEGEREFPLVQRIGRHSSSAHIADSESSVDVGQLSIEVEGEEADVVGGSSAEATPLTLED